MHGMAVSCDLLDVRRKITKNKNRVGTGNCKKWKNIKRIYGNVDENTSMFSSLRVLVIVNGGWVVWGGGGGGANKQETCETCRKKNSTIFIIWFLVRFRHLFTNHNICKMFVRRTDKMGIVNRVNWQVLSLQEVASRPISTVQNCFYFTSFELQSCVIS